MLYFVGTPIGNLKDISFRAVETLKSVDVIACEDTRHSLALLNAYDIKKPLVSYHKFNERESGAKIIERLKAGENVALITDAGMPVISDPGNLLVPMLVENGLDFTVVPGATAFVSALVLGGLDCSKFCFLGFLPDKAKDKKKLLEKYKELDMTVVFYSAPHDIKDNIAAIYEAFGDREAVAVKEITKLHEGAERFFLSAGLSGEPRGEYVLLVSGAAERENELNSLTEKEHIDYYVKQGLSTMEALKKAAKDRGVSKSSLYKFTLE